MLKRAKTLSRLLYLLGPRATLWFVADKLLQHVSKARVLLVFLRQPELLAGLDPMLPAGLTAEVRRPDQMGKLAAACAEVLGADFLTEARNNGAECVVILEGDTVVSFQWLSNGLTWAYDDIWIGFGPNYLYGHNSFTAPSHRGRRLNYSGVVVAAQALAVPKGKGLAGYIVGSNIASLLAHTRVSRKYSGIVCVWPHGKHGLRTFASRSLRAAGLQLVRKAATPSRASLKAGSPG
jgi:hypothetical protein